MNGTELLERVKAEFPVRDSWDGEVPFRGYQGAYWGEKGEGWHEFFHDLHGSKSPVTVKGLGTFAVVDKSENYDEAGDIEAELIFTFTPRIPQPALFDEPSQKTYKITAQLDSWMGGPWNEDVHEVKPVEKTITVWERV